MTGVALVATVPIALAAGASAPRPQAPTLPAPGTSLDARAARATLELYALEAELARARTSLDTLAARRSTVAQELALAQRQLRIARRAFTGSQSQLATLVRALYEEPHRGDPLSVLLGAESLEEALAGLDSLSRAAGESSRIVDQARLARERLEELSAELRTRDAELRQLVAAAHARTTHLARTAEERKRFVAGLREQQRLQATRISAIEETARRAGRRAAETSPSEPAASVATAPANETAPAVEAPLVLGPAGPRALTVSATGYALGGRTATGVPTGPGVVAVDPAVIPLGSRITIPGYGSGIAADTGGAVVGNVIDVWFPTLEEARAWGRRTVTITVH